MNLAVVDVVWQGKLFYPSTKLSIPDENLERVLKGMDSAVQYDRTMTRLP